MRRLRLTQSGQPQRGTAVDHWRDVAANVQEALELYCDDETIDIPAPTPLDALQDLRDCKDGTWAMIGIDLGKLDTRKERVIRLH